MLSIFLSPFPFRGVEAPYLWVFYKFLHESTEPLNFLVSQDYLKTEQYFSEDQRWEVESETYPSLGYNFPTDEVLARHNFTFLPEYLFEKLIELSNDNPIQAFKLLLTKRIAALEEAFDQLLDSTVLGDSEAIITCINCPSLEAAAHAKGIPVIHVELGPLRAPNYRWTAYFDFTGVNGNTEAESRFLKASAEFGDDLPNLDAMREFFFLRDDISVSPVDENANIGIPLQVEDDSNLVAYGNGYDNNSLISYAMFKQNKDLLIRAHPNSVFSLKNRFFSVDSSANSIEFIEKCKKILTINSSVGLEAMLFGRTVQTVGDSSYSFINTASSEQERLNRFAFYLFCYLVPFRSVFDPSYIRFRLQNPSEIEILKRHLEFYGHVTDDNTTLAKIILDGTTKNMMEKMARKQAEMNEKISHLTAEGGQLSADNERFSADIERLKTDIEQLMANIEPLTIYVEQLAVKNEQLIEKNEQLSVKNDQLTANIEQFAAKNHQLTADIEQFAKKNDQLSVNIEQFADNIKQISTKNDHLTINIEQLSSEMLLTKAAKEKLFNTETENNSETVRLIEAYAQALSTERAQLSTVLSSSSWKVTKPFRFSRRIATRLIQRLPGFFRRIKQILVTIKADPKILLRTVSYFKNNGIRATLSHSSRAVEVNFAPTSTEIRLSRQDSTYILTTHHCLFVAELIKKNLEKAGFSANIIFGTPDDGFASSLHFVICPQMFTSLPGLYVAFQMEQSVSSRWFEDNYIRTLENSFAIFDYSTTNIEFLQSKGLSHRQIYYMPISYIPNYAQQLTQPKEYDVIFYGDVNNDRRKEYLDTIKNKYKTKIINNIFGEELYNEISKARIVVNIHYYEGALLETTRIYECLSRDALIVSEKSSDMLDHANLQDIVDFTEIGDVSGMLERIDYWLSNEAARAEKIHKNKIALQHLPNEFEYYFNRFLLATDNIDFDTFYHLAGHNIKFNTDMVCLGLPESTERKQDFEKDNTVGFQYFPGLRHSIGWIGCGLSYKFIMRKASEQSFENITVCEDDVELLDGWKPRFDQIHTHLHDEKKDWDILSGLIANLHSDTKVKAIETFGDFELIHIDKMISAVLNSYNATVFPKIIAWDENHRDPYVNTIDKFIESQSGVDVITTIPFLVGHKEELTSTLWGFKNTQYSDIISASAALLQEKVDAFKSPTNASQHGNINNT